MQLVNVLTGGHDDNAISSIRWCAAREGARLLLREQASLLSRSPPLLAPTQTPARPAPREQVPGPPVAGLRAEFVPAVSPGSGAKAGGASRPPRAGDGGGGLASQTGRALIPPCSRPLALPQAGDGRRERPGGGVGRQRGPAAQGLRLCLRNRSRPLLETPFCLLPSGSLARSSPPGLLERGTGVAKRRRQREKTLFLESPDSRKPPNENAQHTPSCWPARRPRRRRRVRWRTLLRPRSCGRAAWWTCSGCRTPPRCWPS